MSALYNEIDPFAAQWLRNLVEAGHITHGAVDERSVRDLAPADVTGPGQRHFFAGIGAWSHALRLAEWPDDVDVWTGSCPCQPFSAAGKRKGFDDDRHLWPAWFRLIRECRPAIVFGEQVASPDGLKWLDAVHADMEGAGYAFGAADLCAAGVGAPHIRQRLYFVAITDSERLERVRVQLREWGSRPPLPKTDGRREAGDLADDDDDEGLQGRGQRWDGTDQLASRPCGVAGAVGDAARQRSERSAEAGWEAEYRPKLGGATRGFWHPADWVPCRDGKARPVEPGTFPLAHGAPSRVGRLRTYGNAIVPQVAATFIRAVIDHLTADANDFDPGTTGQLELRLSA